MLSYFIIISSKFYSNLWVIRHNINK